MKFTVMCSSINSWKLSVFLFVFLCHFWWYPSLSASSSHANTQPTKLTWKKSNFWCYFCCMWSHFQIRKHEEKSTKVILLVRFQWGNAVNAYSKYHGTWTILSTGLRLYKSIFSDGAWNELLTLKQRLFVKIKTQIRFSLYILERKKKDLYKAP